MLSDYTEVDQINKMCNFLFLFLTKSDPTQTLEVCREYTDPLVDCANRGFGQPSHTPQ